jgi:hypothetical protein
MEVRRQVVRLTVLLGTIGCLLNCPAGHSLPVDLRNGDPRIDIQPNLQKAPFNAHKKNRYARETSESILTMTTTSQPVTDANTEGSGAEIQAQRCNPKMRRTNSPCKSLKEKLLEYFGRNELQLPLDTFYNSFVLADIYSLIGGPSSRLPVSQSTRDFGVTTCAAIVERHYRPRAISNGLCSWNYSCSYSPTRFPSFKVEARLSDESYLTRQLCNPVRMEDVTYFEQVDCPEDPCSRENWVQRRYDVVVGFRESPITN